MKVQQDLEKIVPQFEAAKKRIYSANIDHWTGMVKALYKEFQELIGPEEITRSSYMNIGNDEAMPSKWTKNGMKLTNDQVISVEEYVERILKPESNVENKYMLLRLLVDQITKLEETYHKKLTGKYLKKEDEEAVKRRIKEEKIQNASC